MKLLSWNVNGIRAAAKKGFLEWLEHQQADVVCLQEIKAKPEQLEPELRSPAGWQCWWHPAEKPGYSGVALFSRSKPLDVKLGLGVPAYDSEGRVITAEYKDFYLLTAYFPNTQRDHARLGFKLEFSRDILALCQKLARKKGVVLCGDYNVAHQEDDLANPKSNRNNAGFLPEERAWMDDFLAAGFVDVFRSFHSGNGHYTWWSNRPGVRAKNIGWRIDYHCVSADFAQRVRSAAHQPHVLGSDHCPIELVLG